MTFTEAANKIKSATFPEDVFTDAFNVEAVYKELAKIVHPDINKNSAESIEVFKLLGELHAIVLTKVKANTYGIKNLGTVTKKGGTTYTLQKQIGRDALAKTFSAESKTKQVTCKIYYSAATKDFAINETNTLKAIHESAVKDLTVTKNHLPVLVDSFQLDTKQYVNIFNSYGKSHTFKQVKEKYNNGIKLEHAAWMFNRMLGSLLAVHQAGFVHNSLTPDSFLIYPETHNGLLTNFAYSTKLGQPLKGYNPQWKDFYAHELLEKRATSFGSDIYMAAKCIIYLIGADSLTKTPEPFQSFIRYCTMGMRFRPQDVWELHNDFRELLKTIFGEPKFHEFKM